MPRCNKENSKSKHIPEIIYSTFAEKRFTESSQSGAAYFFQKRNRFKDRSRALKNIISLDWT